MAKSTADLGLTCAILFLASVAFIYLFLLQPFLRRCHETFVNRTIPDFVQSMAGKKTD